MFQFIFAGSGAGVVGKKASTNANTKNISAAMLKGKLQAPRLKLDGGSGCPDQRRQIRQPMDVI